MKKYILAIDQGTTSSRAIIFNKNGEMVSSFSKPVTCYYPFSGWVESDANEIYDSVKECIFEVLAKSQISVDEIASIGITNQRETTVVWSKKTHNPIYHAIVWQSRQSLDICNSLASYKEVIHKKTGLLINPYFSASKIRFILDHAKNGQLMAESGELCFGTIDSWLIYKLTGGALHATDVSNASRTLLYNINTMKWDDELCQLFNVPMIMLPTVYPSSYNYGFSTDIGYDIPIGASIGDQQAALFGQTCFSLGDSKNTYGTGCFMLLNTLDKPFFSKKGLLTTVAWQIKDQVTYALEGSVFMGGAVIQWLRDEMHLINSAKESEDHANKTMSSGIYVIPSFTGLGTPYWDDEARGAVFGLTRSTNNHQFVRACLEAICYQCKDVFETMKEESGINLTSLFVDGGASANNFLLQFQSDLLGINIVQPECLETTALGAAFLAGLSFGLYTDLKDIKKYNKIKKTITPKADKEEINKLYEGYKCAVNATRMFKVK